MDNKLVNIDSFILESFQEIADKYKEYYETHNIYIYGAGLRGFVFSNILLKNNVSNFYFVDANKNKIGHLFNDKEIISIESIKTKNSIIFLSPQNINNIKIDKLENSCIIVNLGMKSYDLLVKNCIDFKNKDILYLGDCGTTRVLIDDKSYLNLGEMTSDKLGIDTKVIAHFSLQFRDLYVILNNIINKNKIPKKVIWQISLEQFFNDSYLSIHMQHTKLFEIFAKEYNSIEVNEHLRISEKRLKNNIIFDAGKEKYNFSIDEKSEPMIYFNNILKLFRYYDIPLYVYIHPIEYNKYIFEYSESFVDNHSKNISIITKTVEKFSYGVFDYTNMKNLEMDNDSIFNSYEMRKRLSDILEGDIRCLI